MKPITILAAAGAALASAAPALAAPWTFTSLYTFASSGDGTGPQQIAFVDGMIYGVTVGGGANNLGTIFQFNPSTNTESVLTNFVANNEAGYYPDYVTLMGKKLLISTLEGGAGSGDGPGSGTIYEYNTAHSKGNVLFDFDRIDPACFSNGLTNVAGKYYGTCPQGSLPNDYGILFELDPATGAGTLLYLFTDSADGGYPAGQVAYANGVIYGAVQSVNGDGNGGIFAYNLSTGTETILHHFNGGSEGADPSGVAFCKGTLYGFNNFNGAQNKGTAFSFDPATGTEATVYTFQGGTDSAQPFASTPVCLGNALYATAGNGGQNTYGTVFELTPATGKEKILHSFNGQDGDYPIAGLTNYKGTLYGTTVWGTTSSGLSESGTIFKLSR